MSSYIVDPVSRIEGHLGIEVEVDGGVITGAKATGNLWRGFENFMLGREMNDAITFVQRICGVCPVPHGLTATYAADACLGYSKGHITFADDGYFGVPVAAVMIRNMLTASDSIMSAITHFYHLAAPSYVQGPNMAPWTPYFSDSYYDENLLAAGESLPATSNDNAAAGRTLWQAVIASYVKALAIRRKVFEANALYAGRQPMTSSFVAGGVTVNLATAKQDLPQYIELMNDVQAFVIKEYVPIVLALGALYPAFDHNHTTGADGYGSGLGKFLSWGHLPNADGTLCSKGGFINVSNGADAQNFVVSNKADVYNYFLGEGTTTEVEKGSVAANLTESIAHSWYDVSALDTDAYDEDEAAYPLDVQRTMPLREKADAYSFMKAPRWGGTAVEVGPEARMYVNGHFVKDAYLAATVPGYALYAKTAIEISAPVASLSPAPSPELAAALAPFISAGVLTVPAGAKVIDLGLSQALMTELVVILVTTLDAAPSTFLALNTDLVAPGIASALVTSGLLATVQDFVLDLKAGLSIMDRLRARGLECLLYTINVLGDEGIINPAGATGFVETLGAVADGQPTYFSKLPTAAGSGWGAVEAARGALMHMSNMNADGTIASYQCIVPTTWNGSPVVGDAAVKANHGAIEAACIDTGFLAVAGTAETNGGLEDGYAFVNDVEVLRVAQSFDPCIACAIH